MKRRGIVKEAYYELAKRIGMSKTSSNLDFSVIAAINRKLLDETASRFYFIEDYKKITVKGAPTQKIELDLHPHHNKGGRKLNVGDKFYVSKKDLANWNDGDLIRLMGCLNFKIDKEKYIFDSLEVKKGIKQKVHWLPTEEVVRVEILMPNCEIVKGFAEKNVKKIKLGDVVQFERTFFARLDKIEKDKYVFWFSHK